jgi:hypothetical protein
MEQKGPAEIGPPVWHNSKFVCALANEERHFGHVVKADQWLAFDATHLNEKRDGIAELGAFESLAAAKEAVERSVARYDPKPAVIHAGMGAYIV